MVAKRIHERVVPFKVEMGTMLQTLGKTNTLEVSQLVKNQKETESTLRQQDKVVTSLCDKYEAMASQLQVLEAGGKQSTDAQRDLMQKARENVRAEALVVLNERLKEEILALEDRLGKRFEEVEKRARGIEKKVDLSKAEQEEQKAHYETLAAKLEDFGKLVAELTVSSSKDHKEDICKLD
jgi:adenine-specific DNA methylase